MNNVKDIVGFRFKPTDHQLIEHYLKKKINDEDLPCDHVQELYAYASSPDLIAKKLKPKRGEAMYMFSSRELGKRKNRNITVGDYGYWKQLGNSTICDKNNVHVGTVKRFEYLKNDKSEEGITTKWLMAEYTMVYPFSSSPEYKDLVLCKIYEKRNNGTEQDNGESESQTDMENVGDSQPQD